MFIGQTVVAQSLSGDSKTSTVYSPWFPSGGDSGVFTLEVLAISTYVASTSNCNVKMTIQTKTTEQADSAAVPKGNTPIDADGISLPASISVTSSSGLLELVRIKFEVDDLETGTDAMVWATFRALAPQWLTH